MFMPDAGQDLNAIVEAVLRLEAEDCFRLSKVVGTLIYVYADLNESLPAELKLKNDFLWGNGFRIRVTPQGRKYFEELEHRDEQEHVEPLVFISCGQSPGEKTLGKSLAEAVNRLPRGEAILQRTKPHSKLFPIIFFALWINVLV
jgi:hypothetical protein